jgi:hypothetical protein
MKVDSSLSENDHIKQQNTFISLHNNDIISIKYGLCILCKAKLTNDELGNNGLCDACVYTQVFEVFS